MTIASNSDFYLNFQQFGDLRLQAREQSGDASKSVAQQFEGLFVQQMLAAMRSAARVDSEQNSSYVEFYQEMHDKQLAQTMSKQGYLGVAQLILQNMPGGEGRPASTQQAPQLDLKVPPGSRRPAAGLALDIATQPQVLTMPPHLQVKASEELKPALAGETSAVRLGKVQDNDFAELGLRQQVAARWSQPQAFVADIWPQAQRTAHRLGVNPALLVAQSALETGWGKHTMKLADGRSSFNLFGIKAGADWDAAVVTRSSLEYRDGALSSEISAFRAYASPAESLADYAEFIESSPRYSAALKAGVDDRGYIETIHRAGYATDPDYADKVMAIMNGETLQLSLANLDPGDKSYG